MEQIFGVIPGSQDAHATLCLGSAPCRVPSLQPGTVLGEMPTPGEGW